MTLDASGASRRSVWFRIAPATFTFDDVADLKFEIDCGGSGGQIVLTALAIDSITREPAPRVSVTDCRSRARHTMLPGYRICQS